jgi:hypothetical protein
VEKEGRGHPGYMVQRIEDGLVWVSQKQAAIAVEVDPSRMSNHLNGRTPQINGEHFARVQLAS